MALLRYNLHMYLVIQYILLSTGIFKKYFYLDTSPSLRSTVSVAVSIEGIYVVFTVAWFCVKHFTTI